MVFVRKVEQSRCGRVQLWLPKTEGEGVRVVVCAVGGMTVNQQSGGTICVADSYQKLEIKA